jgi:hypothetical protein
MYEDKAKGAHEVGEDPFVNVYEDGTVSQPFATEFLAKHAIPVRWRSTTKTIRLSTGLPSSDSTQEDLS